jgi:hypothetical protein
MCGFLGKLLQVAVICAIHWRETRAELAVYNPTEWADQKALLQRPNDSKTKNRPFEPNKPVTPAIPKKLMWSYKNFTDHCRPKPQFGSRLITLMIITSPTLNDGFRPPAALVTINTLAPLQM